MRSPIPIFAGKGTFSRKLRDSASAPIVRCGSLVKDGASLTRAGGLGAGASTSGLGRAAGGGSTTGAANGVRPEGAGGSTGFGLEGAARGALETGAGAGASSVETAFS